MNYLKDYFGIVDKSNLDQLKEIFQKVELKMDVPYGINKVEIKTRETGLPYIMLSVDYNYLTAPGDVTGASMLLLDFDLYEIPGKEFHVLKKLPVIAVPFNLPAKINRQLNLNVCLEHELIHLHDLVALYDEVPEYQTFRYQLDFESCGNAGELSHHTGMELAELFYLETPAHEYNYLHGQRRVFDYHNKRFFNYPVENLKEYVRYSMLKYIDSLEYAYKERAKELEIKKNLFKAEFNKFGKAVYGQRAYEKYRELSLRRRTWMKKKRQKA